MVETIASGLKSLLSEIVFVGGATATLYLPEKETKNASTIRPTAHLPTLRRNADGARRVLDIVRSL